MFNFLYHSKASNRVYLDTASSTPIDETVLAKMTKVLADCAGNSASIHQEGVKADTEYQRARAKVASSLKALPEEIIFTSGGTEANNLAIFGVADSFLKTSGQAGQVITLATEHSSVLEPVKKLALAGHKVVILPVMGNGQLDLKNLKDALTADTFLVSIAIANNEIGTIINIREVLKVIRKHRQDHQTVYPYVHTDACQAPRFLDLNVLQLGVDLMTINSSKIYGPKGVGALFKRRGLEISPQIIGGGQQAGLRSGTINVPAIVGLAEALALCTDKRAGESLELLKWRDYLKALLTESIPQIIWHGDWQERLPNNLNFTIPGLEAEYLVIALDAKGFAVSTGSACSNLYDSENHVLQALYGDQVPREGSVRISLGRGVRKTDLDNLVEALQTILKTQATVNILKNSESAL